MLAEIFMLKLEALLRFSPTIPTTSSDTRFVPVKLPFEKKPPK